MSIHQRLTFRASAKLLAHPTSMIILMITKANMMTSPKKDTSVKRQVLTLTLKFAVTSSPPSSERGVTRFVNNCRGLA